MRESAYKVGEMDFAELNVLFVQTIHDAEIVTHDGGSGVADVVVALGPPFDTRQRFEHAYGPGSVEVDAVVGEGEGEHFSGTA